LPHVSLTTVIFGNDIFVLTGGSYKSSDGVIWTQIERPKSSIGSADTFFFANGKFITYGSGSADNKPHLYTSSDCETWVEEGMANYVPLNSVCFRNIIYGNGVFVNFFGSTVTNTTACYDYSTDAITWSEIDLPAPNAMLEKIAFANGKFLLWCFNTAPYFEHKKIEVYSSTDAVNWKLEYSNDDANFRRLPYLVSCNDVFFWSGGSVWPQIGITEVAGLYSSTDGTSWHYEANILDNATLISDDLNNIAYGNGIYVAVGLTDSAIYIRR
jgi:hypothetical protein